MPTRPLSDELAQEAIDAHRRNHGSVMDAAEELGLPYGTYQHRLKTARSRKLDVDPAIRDSMGAVGTSMVPSVAWIKTRGEDGEPARSVMLRPDQEAQRERTAQEAIEAAASLPRLDPIAAVENGEPHLLNLFTLSDAHIGALAWHKESGDDWDLHIAETMLTTAFRQMIADAPSAETAFLSILGDWMDRDMMEPVTTLSGNVLDTDGRQDKMMDVAIRVLRRVIDEALASHDRVTLLIAEGNHDHIGSRWLTKMIGALYENELRLTVLDDPRPYYAFRFGSSFLGFHHGHMKSAKKAADLALIMADEFSADWGQSAKRYIHTGHLHHTLEDEPRGAKVIQHPTLATRSAWAARHGYSAMREAMRITYHQIYGQVGRGYVTPEMAGP